MYCTYIYRYTMNNPKGGREGGRRGGGGGNGNFCILGVVIFCSLIVCLVKNGHFRNATHRQSSSCFHSFLFSFLEKCSFSLFFFFFFFFGLYREYIYIYIPCMYVHTYVSAYLCTCVT
ncbi:hypothetical protein QBC42DRAFT_102034 [Cladorrhinum samala]|uniref:Uncharacterized protein n=1 Tax=Cladorrhinum samala TaxID=585594 RepID=A0AAV9HMV6_9PEZI|nr:hypothetical protein QBC42DRAFT_102034 [Cladorrhinum samala]